MRKLAKIVIFAFIVTAIGTTGTFAQSNSNLDIGLKGAGASLGLVLPSGGIGATLALAGNAELGTFMNDFHIVGFGQIWRKGYNKSTYWEHHWTEIVFGGGVKYYVPMEGMPFKPYAGGGLVFAISRWSWEYTGNSTWFKGSDSGSDFDIGAQIFAGAEYPVNPKMTAFGEIRYHTNGIDFLGFFGGVTMKLK